jgi:predicted small integral membrane protein
VSYRAEASAINVDVRAITTPLLWHVAYWIIIAGEGLTGFAFAAATLEMAYNLRGDA